MTGGADAQVRRARAWLSRTFEPGPVAPWRYVERVGPVEAYRALRAGAGPATVQAIAGTRAEQDVSLDDLRRIEEVGGRLVVPEDPEWPTAALQALVLAVAGQPDERTAGWSAPDRTRSLVPPLALWVRGGPRLDVAADRSAALVGSRASTAYGEHVTAELAHGLGERGWTTISGGAFGIDAAAHRGAIAAGAPTVAVLACGADKPYPRSHATLFERILDGGLLVSEFPPGCAALGHRFLVRNRLIAALSRGTVVVEAAARSGALATARRAREIGRPVLAVPGPITSAMSVGCHQLLRSGAEDEVRATLVTSAAELLEVVGRLGDDLAPLPTKPTDVRDDLGDVARRVLDACPVRTGAPPERLAGVAGVAVADVLRVLPALEVHGLIQWTGSGWRIAPDKPRGAAR